MRMDAGVAAVAEAVGAAEGLRWFRRVRTLRPRLRVGVARVRLRFRLWRAVAVAAVAEAVGADLVEAAALCWSRVLT